jgi:hypothetical protein
MRNLALALAIAGGLLAGALGAHAKLPPPPPKSDAEKAAEAEKAAATKAKEAEANAKAVDKVVANYKKNKGIAMDAQPAPAAPAAAAKDGKK